MTKRNPELESVLWDYLMSLNHPHLLDALASIPPELGAPMGRLVARHVCANGPDQLRSPSVAGDYMSRVVADTLQVFLDAGLPPPTLRVAGPWECVDEEIVERRVIGTPYRENEDDDSHAAAVVRRIRWAGEPPRDAVDGCVWVAVLGSRIPVRTDRRFHPWYSTAADAAEACDRMLRELPEPWFLVGPVLGAVPRDAGLSTESEDPPEEEDGECRLSSWEAHELVSGWSRPGWGRN